MHQRSSRLVRAGVLLALAQPVAAQGLADRIAAVRQGEVELHFAARRGVCGDGSQQIRIGTSMFMGRMDDDGYTTACVPGPVRVRLRMEDGAVQDVQTSVGPPRARSTRPAAVDLGNVPAAVASAYFLQLVRTGDGRVSDLAILPAVLADSSYPWRELLAVARDTDTRRRGTRTSAAFWTSRFAAAKLDGHENDLAFDDGGDEPRDARGSAVFALSQLRNGEGIAPLIQVARTNHEARLRRQALFWLGQSGDPRALALFEEILGR